MSMHLREFDSGVLENELEFYIVFSVLENLFLKPFMRSEPAPDLC